jgi:hypothetical protein
MLSIKALTLWAMFSFSAVLAAPIAGNGPIEKRTAEAAAADYGKYGDYGSYGTYFESLESRRLKAR